MNFLAKNRVLVSILTAFLIIAVATVAIFWARGFKPDFKKGRIDRTGLLVVASTPTGAQVYLDDRLTSVTDTNIAYLDPKTYKVRIEKDGYIKWEKDIEIKADLATEIKALLFPQAPEIKPLTNTGAAAPALSPDGEKLVYGAPGTRGGIYLMPMLDRPFPLRQSPKLLARNGSFDYSKATFMWSPDSKQVIARFQGENEVITANLMVDIEKGDQEPRDVTASLATTLAAWRDDLELRSQTQALLAPDSVKSATAEPQLQASPKPAPYIQINTSGSSEINYYPTGLIFSPDEEKILFKNKEDKYKVHDLKLKKEYTLPDFTDFIGISWFPDSNHFVVVQKDLVSIIEADGYNKMTVFSGKFENGFVFAHPSGTRIIILTTLTQPEGTLPNLYSINLK